ncbi:hypothetical protein [Streptomyces sp. NPDC059080]|uniref:hypothetical protein n=1 Tax=Streptomyces sp. NPDC059080 TaxID=3346718 RepID=UPI00367F2455
MLQIGGKARGQSPVDGRRAGAVLEPCGDGGGQTVYVPSGEGEPVIGVAQARQERGGLAVVLAEVLAAGRFRRWW